MALPAYTDLDSIGRPSLGATLNQVWGDAVDDDVAFLHGESSWTVPTFTNGWSDASGTLSTDPVGFKLKGNTVYLRGAVKGGTLAAAIFTLPAGYRPLNTKYYAVLSNGAIGTLAIGNTGAVSLGAGSNVYVSLDGIHFDII